MGVAAVLLAVLIAQVALAGGESGTGGAKARASASVNQQLKKLKNRVSRLQKQVDQLSRQSGPQGPQGPAGTAPACQGNGSGDTMVSAGAVCIDRYEVSVWSSPTGGTQYGASSDNYPAACTDTGQGCEAGTAGEIYARSVAGVTPSRFINYFQAQQALANSGKRLPTNAEWQQAVAGTPDSTACNVSTGSVASTGSNAGCTSNWGANDMVGNLREWVADWDEQCDGDVTWLGSDITCIGAGGLPSRFPAALHRGGVFSDGLNAGPLAVAATVRPSSSSSIIGFRGAR